MSGDFSRGEHNRPENPTCSLASAMSRALIQASALKPEIRLAQAVSEFQADLSSEERDRFHAQRLQYATVSPVFDDVMRLTAEVNRQASKTSSGQCFGTRFTNFMHLVQQFAAIGDVVVGGSQNLIACGVWALVRMSILSIVSASTYADKLSSLFMDIGRSAPRNQAMALLYPRSRKLQSYLAEYFVVAVNLCRYIYKFGQKAFYQQFVSAMSDAKLQAFRGELDQWANSIKDEVSLLEKQEDAGSRALSRKIFKDASYQRKIATSLRILDFCSTYDYQTAWKQIRKAGNASFFMKLSEYQTWRDCADSCTLVCAGQLGSGKSVMLANIIDDLTLSVGKERCVVTYFFCRHDVPESLKARTILGSLARQMLSTLPDLVELAESYDITRLTSNVEDIVKLVEQGFPSSYKSYVVLDGLDECDNTEREIVLTELQRLQMKFKVLVCASFRKESNNNLRSTTQALVASRILSMPDNNPDIEAFIDMDLARCLDQNRLVIGDPALIIEIQDALLKGSQGMFLWVALQIQSLCDMKTDQAIRDALTDLPKDLSETFERILHKSGGKDQQLQDKTLRLVLAAHRPLTAEELREALSVTPGDATWDPAKVLNDVYSALSCCGCLLTIDEEELTVRVVHHSFRQFILNGSNGTRNLHFTFYDAQNTMADIVITYLGYNVFETQISTTTIQPIVVQSAPSKVIHATMGPSSTMSQLALKLLKSRKQPQVDMSKALAEARSAFRRKSENTFKFHDYAQSHWQDHILFVSGQEDPIVKLVKSAILRMPKPGSVSNEFWTYCDWASKNGNISVLKRLIQIGNIDHNDSDENGLTLSLWAARNGSGTLLEVLLGFNKFYIDERVYEGLTPLAWAAKEGHGVYLEVLLENNILDVDEESCEFTPLMYAIQQGHADIVKLLVNTDKVDVNAKDRDGYTPLMTAVRKGHKDIVELLLGYGKLNVNVATGPEKEPLILAATHGHKDIVGVLLGTGMFDVNVRDRDGCTLLMLAASEGKDDVVKLLLRAEDIDVEAKDTFGYTALMHATRDRHANTAKLLLNFGLADVDAKDNSGWTPLMHAASVGKRDVVELLLNHRHHSDINARDNDGWTPLMYAANCGHKEIVELLLNTGKHHIDTMSKDELLQFTKDKKTIDVIKTYYERRYRREHYGFKPRR